MWATPVESSGGVLGVGAGNELSFVNAGVIKDKVDALMALSAELVQQPAFDQRELDRQKQQAMSGMQVSYDDPEFVAGVVYDRLIYGFHPYGRSPGGTLESIAKISRNDLIAFHRTWFAPNNSILAIVGDLTADEMFASAEKAFGGWPKRDVPAQTQMDPPPPTYRVVVVDKPGAVQTEIRAGNLTLARTSPKWLDVELLIRVLGGEGANRLFGVLRSERGLLHCRIELPGGLGAHCVCVHLSLFGYSRRLQVAALADYLETVSGTNEPLIIAGDFNDWSNRAGRQLAKRLGLTEVFSNRKGAPVRSYPAVLPMFRLDRIYVRGFKVRRTEVHFGQPWSAISDHAALSAHLARHAR